MRLHGLGFAGEIGAMKIVLAVLLAWASFTGAAYAEEEEFDTDRQTSPVFANQNDCRAFAYGQSAMCQTNECRGALLGILGYCRSSDCRAIALRNYGFCQTRDCRAYLFR